MRLTLKINEEKLEAKKKIKGLNKYISFAAFYDLNSS